MSWNLTPLSHRLGITYPLIQAPMAGGFTSPELVAGSGPGGCFGERDRGSDPPGVRRFVRSAGVTPPTRQAQSPGRAGKGTFKVSRPTKRYS